MKIHTTTAKTSQQESAARDKIFPILPVVTYLDKAPELVVGMTESLRPRQTEKNLEQLLSKSILYTASEPSQYLFMKIEIRGIYMRHKSITQYVRRLHKMNERNAHAQYKISLRTFLNGMLVFMFCDRNSSAKKRKNFQHER